MRIVTVDSYEKLKKMLKHYHPSNVEVVLVSTVLSPNQIDKDFTVHNYEVLIPPPKVISKFLSEGTGKWYRDEYYEYLTTPLAGYFLNEIIYRLTHLDREMIIACSMDEQEFEYMPFISNTIEEVYNCIPITYKDWKRDVDMHMDYSMDYLYEQSGDMRMMYLQKLKDSRYYIPDYRFIRMGKYDLKKLTKEERKEWKRLVK